MQGLLILLNLLGGLAVFLYGLRVMSEALQKAAGSRLRGLLRSATSNRFSATLTGFLTTVAVQSSTATTVMVVAFCSAGLLNLFQALGIIFGANIGTTTTGWLVSLIGFRFQVTTFALPAVGVGFFLQYLRRWPRAGRIGEVLIGFGLLFLGLELIKNGVPDLRGSPEVMAWLAAFDASDFGPRLALVLLGTGLTVLFQSSSAVMVLTLTAAATGLIDFPTACAVVLGENIGTTITANLAAVGAPRVARQAARGHLLFNLIGVSWAIVFFNPFLSLVAAVVPGDPYLTTEAALLIYIPAHVAAFHTIFNVASTSVFLAGMAPFERLVLRLTPHGKEEVELRFIESTLTATSELAINAARNEADHMAGVVVTSMVGVRDAIQVRNGEFFRRQKAIHEAESKTDWLEHRITDYLTALVRRELSPDATAEVLDLLHLVSQLERMADHSDKLVNLLARTWEEELPLSAPAQEELVEMAAACVEIAEEMRACILDPDPGRVAPAKEREQALDAMRNRYRDAHNLRLAQGRCSTEAGIVFADMLTSFERFGDHGMKVVYLAVGRREKRSSRTGRPSPPHLPTPGAVEGAPEGEAKSSAS